ncbi:hypothetical protein J5Y04_14280 [Kitasatospora sp. RG8]|uniref:hypothetical protein n=1 Tax=Kitasatospora sp. RG8 TaxID=2820815 RepID=UPI001AE0974D|nr:hypothetical protein [Kitasatospora sp. RG8]MBP0450702.1 hypothetical protein [Kitasatospora sp. RG8]
MPKPGKPRTTTVDGVEVVVLTPEQHAGLESARRQLGGQQAQVARMKLDLHRGRQLLAEVERVLAGIPTDQSGRLDGRLGPGRGLPELLADIRAFLPPTPPVPPRPADGPTGPRERARSPQSR